MNRFASLAALSLSAVASGFIGAWLFSFAGFADHRTRTYLVDHPQVLTQMVDGLQRQEAQARLSGIEDEVERPFPGAVLGNPKGTKTLVEFSDYHCGYCRLSSPAVEALIRSDPNVRVVVREWPIFDGSERLARLALASAQQGKFAAFHDAMFAHQGERNQLENAARDAGVDLARARRDADSDAITAELRKNAAIAQRLAFSGTPSWVAHDTILQGAQDSKALAAALVPGET